MGIDKETLKLIEDTKKIVKVDAVLEYDDETEDWLKFLIKDETNKIQIDIVSNDNFFENELELTGKYDEDSSNKLRGLLISEGYKMPEVKITDES